MGGSLTQEERGQRSSFYSFGTPVFTKGHTLLLPISDNLGGIEGADGSIFGLENPEKFVGSNVGWRRFAICLICVSAWVHEQVDCYTCHDYQDKQKTSNYFTHHWAAPLRLHNKTRLNTV